MNEEQKPKIKPKIEVKIDKLHVPKPQKNPSKG